jgi:D-3-phosphoglycerate dehydrogenase
MRKVLLADKLPDQCVAMLKEAGLEVVNRPGLPEDQLAEAVRGMSAVICRSGVKITAKVLDGADKLEAVCRAGVGVDNIDVDAASRKGVVVMNTPGGNTVSTAEHTFALILGLARNIGPAYIAMREGRWEKKKFIGSQLAGSTLGVIGLGRIGQEVAKRAVAFGMVVRAYDPYVGRDAATKVGAELVESLDDLLKACDFLTVHVPGSKQTQGLVGKDQIALMKKTACIVNCARGGIVDQDAALEAVRKGKLGGAALDVFPKEPPDSFEFAKNDRVLATPHLGASTEEAQLAVAIEAAEEIIDALTRRHFRNAVNIAALPPEEMKAVQPYCDLAAQLGKLVAQLGTGRPQSLEVACRGAVAQENIEPIVSYGAMGVMESSLGAGVNIVSAPLLARDRGITITGSSTVGADDGFTDLVEVKLTTSGGAVEAAGTLFGRRHPRIVRIAGFSVEITPEGHVLVVFGNDVPGLIGRVGAILGAAGVNIARMGFGRQEAGGKALLALNLDSRCDRAVLDAIRTLNDVERAVAVDL